ncbi:hypothetical protein M0805_008143 [Coniferiporia weirii]|nr:hypothetical protein M0805_008143 [Coniferiporia weirii]
MAKKKAGDSGKAAAKVAKKAKAAQKIERKEQKKVGKSKKDDRNDEEDLETILENMRKEWEEAHTVTEEIVEGPPSRRANATLTACPSGNYLWCIGGEFFSDDGKAYFYNDVYRYTPEKNEWRKFVSQTCPGPRSAHAVVASPASGGKLFLFGGEFSSLYQNSFHHYRDFWCFDVSTHTWDRIETKVRPSARSGCRMVMWKHYIFLFGGFYDPGIRTKYLNDLWYFDTQEYRWRQIEFREGDRQPSPRSGFSFLSTPDGIVLHGGYCKEYAKGKRPVGIMLDDTWFLRLTLNTANTPASGAPPKLAKGASAHLFSAKWEKRKKVGYAPSLRSGCTMTLWSAKGMGVLFGGVTDEDTSEETLESIFHNDMYGYQPTGNGRWVTLGLRKPKGKGKGTGGRKAKPVASPTLARVRARAGHSGEGSDNEEVASDDNDGNSDGEDRGGAHWKTKAKPEPRAPAVWDAEADPDDPLLTIPRARYNAMLAVLRNTLYIYAGILEMGPREYTLDDFYALPLDKLDRFVCLKPCDVALPKEGDILESSDEDDEDDDGDEDEDDEDDDDFDGDYGEEDDDEERSTSDKKEKFSSKTKLKKNKEEPEDELGGVKDGDQNDPAPEPDLRAQARAFLGATPPSAGPGAGPTGAGAAQTAEDALSTPLPGETLAAFYARSREYWAGKALGGSENRGKSLRRDGFALAQERYAAYKPVLEEVEKILAEAGLDEDEIRRGAAAGGGAKGQGENRNRR